MIEKKPQSRGRLIRGGLFWFLCAIVLLACPVASAEPRVNAVVIAPGEIVNRQTSDQEENATDRNVRFAVERIEKLKKEQPLNLDALRHEYLILFGNFPRREEGKQAIFELYHLMRQHKLFQDSYATLARILDLYQDHETMTNPFDAGQKWVITATALVEMADLYANGMQLRDLSIQTQKRTMVRFPPHLLVGTKSSDRSYSGELGIMARLFASDYYRDMESFNMAGQNLLEIVRDFPGKMIMLQGQTLLAATAAVQRIPALLTNMPASQGKKINLIHTFFNTAIDHEARVWLLFVQADVHFSHYERWEQHASVEQGLETLRDIIFQHHDQPIETDKGREPAGVRALRLYRDKLIGLMENHDRACQDLLGFYNRFAKNKKTRYMAAYCLFYLAEIELEHRQNPAAAFKLFNRVVDEYGDITDYPQTDDEATLLQIRAEQSAQKAKLGM